MAYSLNAVQLIGRTGREPEMRYASTGKPYTTFSLATDRRAKSDGQPVVDWYIVICWDKLAEFANQYLRKGRLLYVGGRLSYRVWTGVRRRSRRTQVRLPRRKPWTAMVCRSRLPTLRLRSRRGRLVCLIQPRRPRHDDGGPRLLALVAGGRPPFLRRLALYRSACCPSGAPRAA